MRLVTTIAMNAAINSGNAGEIKIGVCGVAVGGGAVAVAGITVGSGVDVGAGDGDGVAAAVGEGVGVGVASTDIGDTPVAGDADPPEASTPNAAE